MHKKRAIVFYYSPTEKFSIKTPSRVWVAPQHCPILEGISKIQIF